MRALKRSGQLNPSLLLAAASRTAPCPTLDEAVEGVGGM